MPDPLTAALAYLAAGRSVVPIAPHRKAPSIFDAGRPHEIPWQRYQRTPPLPGEVRSWYRGRPLMGVGIVAGPVSGATLDDGTQTGLECLDIDAPDIVPVFEGLVHVRGYAALLGRLPCEETPKGGRHYGYLCIAWAGNASSPGERSASSLTGRMTSRR